MIQFNKRLDWWVLFTATYVREGALPNHQPPAPTNYQPVAPTQPQIPIAPHVQKIRLPSTTTIAPTAVITNPTIQQQQPQQQPQQANMEPQSAQPTKKTLSLTVNIIHIPVPTECIYY